MDSLIAFIKNQRAAIREQPSRSAYLDSMKLFVGIAWERNIDVCYTESVARLFILDIGNQELTAEFENLIKEYAEYDMSQPWFANEMFWSGKRLREKMELAWNVGQDLHVLTREERRMFHIRGAKATREQIDFVERNKILQAEAVARREITWWENDDRDNLSD